jgi:hypothetical protein
LFLSLCIYIFNLLGLRFIGHNLSSVTTDGDVGSRPVGFNVIFPGMLARCIGMGVEMPLAPADVDGIFRLRDKELPRWLDVDFGTSTIMFPKTNYVTLTTNLPSTYTAWPLEAKLSGPT